MGKGQAGATRVGGAKNVLCHRYNVQVIDLHMEETRGTERDYRGPYITV